EGGLAPKVRPDPAHGVVRDGKDRDQVLPEVEPEGEHRFEDCGEPVGEIPVLQVRQVEISARMALAAGLRDDRASDDIARSQLPLPMVIGKEPASVTTADER